MTPETATIVKHGAAGLFVGVVLTLLIGINGGLLVLKHTAQKMVTAAVVATKVEICVVQFTKSRNFPERLKEFKALNFIQRDEFIEKGGWDRMPGEEIPNNEVNRACGDRIAALS